MAAYNDQFDRHNPFAFDPGFAFGARLRSSVFEARELLADRSANDLKSIARQVSRIIDAAALELGRAQDFSDAEGDWSDCTPEEAAAYKTENTRRYGEMLRWDLGEAAILQTAAPQLCRSDVSGMNAAFERHEAFAVMALWLAVDCVDELDGKPTRRVEQPSPADQERFRQQLEELFPDGVPIVGPGHTESEAALVGMDAMRASALAVEAASRYADFDVLRKSGVSAEAIEVLEVQQAARQQRDSEKAANAARARWDHLPAFRAEAFRLATSQRFASRASAAKFAADKLDCKPRPKSARKGDPDEYYPWTTVDEWLADMNWVAVDEAAPPDASK